MSLFLSSNYALCSRMIGCPCKYKAIIKIGFWHRPKNSEVEINQLEALIKKRITLVDDNVLSPLPRSLPFTRGTISIGGCMAETLRHTGMASWIGCIDHM